MIIPLLLLTAATPTCTPTTVAHSYHDDDDHYYHYHCLSGVTVLNSYGSPAVQKTEGCEQDEHPSGKGCARKHLQ